MDPDKAKKIVGIVISLPLFILGLGLILGLPWWLTLALAIAIPAITLVAWLTPSFLQLQRPTPAQPAGPSLKSRIFGAGGSLLLWAIGVIILLVVLWPFFGPADKVYTAEEFSKVGCSVVALSSSGCTLNGTEKMSIVKIVIIPESLPTGGEIWISIGPYQFEYLSYSAKADEDYYKGEVYQQGNWGKITYAPQEHGKPNDMPVPIMVMTNGWYRIPVLGLIPALLDSSPYPVLMIKSRLVYESLAQGERLESDPPVQGPVVIRSSGQGIKEVKIYYGSLFRTIAGLIGMS